jgi:hypothetical protein
MDQYTAKAATVAAFRVIGVDLGSGSVMVESQDGSHTIVPALSAVVTSNPVRFGDMYIPAGLGAPTFIPAATLALFYAPS